MDTVDLSKFVNPDFDRGASRAKEAVWLVLRQLIFLANPFRTYGLKRAMLRFFGAQLGEGFVCKPRAAITFPWKFRAGRHCWIGDDVCLLNLDTITLGSNVCISQRAFLCTGSHDWADPEFGLIHRPITLEDGVWVCANVFIGPGVTVGRNSVITAGSVVSTDLPANMICSGNPCTPVKPRILRQTG